MENRMTTRPNRMKTFMDGAINGAVNGALMLGIFTALMAGASAVGIIAGGYALGSAIATLAIGTVATSIFGGIASVRKENKELSMMQHEQGTAKGRSPVAEKEITHGTTVAIPVMADKSPETAQAKGSSWRARVGESRSRDASFAKSVESERAQAAERSASIA